MTLLEIENQIGVKFSEMTMEDLGKLTTNEKFMQALTSPDTGLLIAEEVLATNKDEEVKSEFAPLKFHHLLYDDQIILSQMFAEYGVDKDETKLVNNLNKFIDGASPLGKLSAYLLCLTSLEGYDFTDERINDLKAAIKESSKILESIDIEKGFPVACDLIDMFYTLQQEYFKKFKIDILNEDDLELRLNNIVSDLNTYANGMYDHEIEEIKDSLPENAKPEDYGFVDVTKFKKETEE